MSQRVSNGFNPRRDAIPSDARKKVVSLPRLWPPSFCPFGLAEVVLVD